MSSMIVDRPLIGLNAFITGAASGIGRSIANELGRCGASLYLVDLDENQLNQTVIQLKENTIHADSSKLDVTVREECFRVVEAATALRQIDILVNAAGLYRAASFLESQPSDFQKLLDVNLFGLINLMQAVIPGMKSRGFGRILNIASTAGKVGSANQSAYTVSKHAVIGLTRSIAIEFAKTGITANAICPGPVRTQMLQGLWETQAKLNDTTVEAVSTSMISRVPIGRLIESDEIATLAAHLATRGASGINAQAFNVDGGMIQA